MKTMDVFILDDSPSSRKYLSRQLVKDGFSVLEFPNFKALMDGMNNKLFLAGFVDHSMPDISGSEAIKKLRVQKKDMLIYGYTGSDDSITKEQLMNSGASGVIVKGDLDKPIYRTIVKQIKKASAPDLTKLFHDVLKVIDEFENRLNEIESRVEQAPDKITGVRVAAGNKTTRNLTVVETNSELSKIDEKVQKQLSRVKKEIFDSLFKKLKSESISVNDELIKTAVDKQVRSINEAKLDKDDFEQHANNTTKLVNKLKSKLEKSVQSIQELTTSPGKKNSPLLSEELQAIKQEYGAVSNGLEELGTRFSESGLGMNQSISQLKNEIKALSEMMSKLNIETEESKITSVIKESFDELSQIQANNTNAFLNEQGEKAEQQLENHKQKTNELERRFETLMEKSKKYTEEELEKFVRSYEPTKEDLMVAVRGVSAVPKLITEVASEIEPLLMEKLNKEFINKMNSLQRKSSFIGFLVGVTVAGMTIWTWWYFY